jgi:uncharacterized protein YbjT (DUF2867 family)
MSRQSFAEEGSMAGGDGPVLVIGSTGQQGGAVARALLERGWEVRALVRDRAAATAQALREAGAVLVPGDLDDLASLRAAMTGVHAVFLVLTMMAGPRVSLAGVAAEVRRGRAVADLAAEAGVAHLVYSSIHGAGQQTGIAHVDSKNEIEEAIRDSGVPATILRPVFFMDNFTTLTRPVLSGGELTVSLALAPITPLAVIATGDIGAFAAIAFGQPDRFTGRQVEIAGDCLTGPQIAEAFGRAAGVPARFRQATIEQVRVFDPEVAKMFAWLDTRAGPSPDLAGLRAIHPGLMTLDGWLRATGWKPADAESPAAGAARPL